MGKIKELWKEHRREILVGVIVSIITTGLWSAITWFIRESPKMGETLLESLRNIFYRSAALHTESSTSEMILGVLFGVMFGIIFGFTKYIKQKVQKRIEEMEDRINSDAEKEDDEQENDLSKKERLENMKKSKGSLTFLIILLVFILVSIMSLAIIPADIYKKFNRDITMISPYVEFQEITQLKSDWVLMDGYDDYKDIYVTINEIKEENNLPKRQ